MIRVEEVWRFPVKSMRGERIDAAEVGERGLSGDRAYAVADATTGMLLTAKRDPVLLTCSAATTDGGVVVTLPDGTGHLATEAAVLEDKLAALLGRDVRFRALDPGGRASYDLPRDYQAGEGEPIRFPCPEGTFFDITQVHVLTTATLEALRASAPGVAFDVRRFRPNLVLSVQDEEGFVEDGWVGRTIDLGQAAIEVSRIMPRCAMTTRAQDDLPADKDVLKSIAQVNGANAGVCCDVVRAGAVRAGEVVDLV